ncbi:hypothetical protein SFRURICE_004962 [Spodoptera frugiperda]|nr:hypothetical protein SFRURICE_004962 [Spodoptera frugiperda]
MSMDCKFFRHFTFTRLEESRSPGNPLIHPSFCIGPQPYKAPSVVVRRIYEARAERDAPYSRVYLCSLSADPEIIARSLTPRECLPRRLGLEEVRSLTLPTFSLASMTASQKETIFQSRP